MVGGFVGLVNFESRNAQGTDVSGDVYDGAGGPWTMAGSPYIVVGDVTVPTGQTLTIEAGVVVKIDFMTNIYVDGTLIAIGTETNRINITSNMIAPAPGDWGGIRIYSLGYVEIKYSDITYGYYGISLYLSNNNMITNNNISSNNYNGIHLQSSNNNIITNNNISSNDVDGINLESSSNNNRITNNNISSNNYNGIHLQSSNNNIITNNNISSNYGYGIYLESSSNTDITNNNFVIDGIYIGGDQLLYYNTHTIPDTNMVNGKPLYYHKNINGMIIDGIPVGQLILANCTDVDVKNIQINNTDMGIMEAYSTNITIANSNILSNNRYGIYFVSSGGLIAYNNITSNGYGIRCERFSYLTITHNDIISNSDDGIALSISYAIVTNNYISNNRIGIRTSSSDPYIANNTIVNNWVGIYFSQPTVGTTINNTIKDNTDRGVWLSGNNAPTFVNCTIENSKYAFFIVGSDPTTINTTFDGSKVYFSTSWSTLTVKNYLHVLVLDATSAPIPGADINVTDNGNPITLGSGGIDPQTDVDGFVRWIVVTDRIYYGSSTATENITTAEVSYPLKTFVDNPRDVNMSTSHTEVFVEVGGVILPDFVLSRDDITFNPPSPVKDKTLVTIGATIHNIGLEEGLNIVVRFYDGIPSPANLIGEDQIPSIPALGGVGLAEVVWSATPVGMHNIYVVVDPDNTIVETNEANNIANRTIDVGIPLYKGWNLISIPYIQSNTNLGSVLSSITGSYDAVQWYNISDISDQWKHYQISKPSNLNDLDDIDHTMGFWVHITQPGETIFIFNGIQPTENQSITLYPGWNHVGYPSLTSYNRTDGLNNVTFGQDVDSIWSYDIATQKWKELDPLDYFELGRGYWIHAKIKCVWEVQQ